MTESIWNVRKSAEKSRVRFVRMPGTRLSPPPNPQFAAQVHVYGESCASEAYFGDCSRDSSIERAPTPPAITSTKGRLYERGADGDCGIANISDVLNNAFKSFCQLRENGTDGVIVHRDQEDAWGDSEWTRPVGDPSNIWAPVESDWALMGPEPASSSSWPLKVDDHDEPADDAVQLSLALLNHHPERSSFSPVMTKSLQKALPKNSKLLEWLANLASTGQTDPDKDEQEVEHILQERPEDEEEENLLTSPKTHFCPIQQEGDVEVQVI